MLRIKEPPVGAGGGNIAGDNTNGTFLLSTLKYSTPHELSKVKQSAARLMWDLAEWHLDRCLVGSPNYARNFWLFVKYLLLEDKLREQSREVER